MKHLLLLLFIVTGLGQSIVAQQNIQRSPQSSAARATTSPGLMASVPTLDVSTNLAVADTLFPAVFGQSCAETLTNFVLNDPNTGFVAGTNSLFDLRKLQRITLPERTNLTISEILVAFSVADDNISDRIIIVEVFEDLDANGEFGMLLGATDTLTVGDLIVSEDGRAFTSFSFSEPLTLNDVSSFLISVDFADLYFNAQDSLDYIGNAAIWSTDDGCGDGENALEIFQVANVGLSFGTILSGWNLNLEFLMGAVVERDPFTSTRTPVANYTTTAAPNPASDLLNLSFTASGNDQMTAALLSTDGRVLRTQASSGSGVRSVQWNVSELPAGVYLYQIAGPEGIETGRVVIR